MSRLVHGNRSCSLCRRRKTRCELPEESLSLAPSDQPLPASQACHRCKVLSLSCVLASPGRKRKLGAESHTGATGAPGRKSPSTAQSSLSASPVDPKGSRTQLDSSISTPDQTTSAAILCPDFLAKASPAAVLENSAPTASTAFDPICEVKDANRLRSTSTQGYNEMRYHGRPLELLCRQINLSGKGAISFPHTMSWVVPDLTEHITDAVIASLNTMHSSLFSYLPYLAPLPELLQLYQSDKSDHTNALNLLLSTYLTCSSLPETPSNATICKMAQNSTQVILPWVLAHLPRSLRAIQSLTTLFFFAPYGLLPGQTTDGQPLEIARGYVCSARGLAEQMGIKGEVYRLLGTGPSTAWESESMWTWLTLTLCEAVIALEDPVPKVPAQLDEAAQYAEWLYRYAVTLDPKSSVPFADSLRILGKISICERLQRLAHVFSGLANMYLNFELNGTILLIDASTGVQDAHEACIHHIESLQACYDTWLHLTGIAIPSQWHHTREIQHHFEVGKLQRIAVRYAIAGSYLPGAVTAFSDVPSRIHDLPPGPEAQRLNMEYALVRAEIPTDIARFFLQEPTIPAARMAETIVLKRTALLEELLVNFVDCPSMSSSGDGSIPLAPWHMLFAIALNACNVLAEIQAAYLAITRTSKVVRRELKPFQQLHIMRSTAEILARTERPWSTTQIRSPEDTIGRISSRLIKALVALAEARMKHFDLAASCQTVYNSAASIPEMDIWSLISSMEGGGTEPSDDSDDTYQRILEEAFGGVKARQQ